jgi:hypothetical protein
MTYHCVFLLGGIVGLINFLYHLISIIHRAVRKKNEDNILIGCIESSVIFMLVAVVEGGYWLPPTA